DTMRAIDYITSVGAFPTVCVFRPVIGSDMERHPAPRYEDMRAVFEHVYLACRRNSIPIGLAPNIEVSLVCQPDDTRYLAPGGWRSWAYEQRLSLLRRLAGPVFEARMKARGRVAPAGVRRAATPC
ncbi:MAG TPA: hypothetical protein VFV24_01330, partial [Candidatus Eisenbacteria bacterium]|nr:hypothetical protein [Candidatus Eisenbacteria bacterium]